MSIKIKTRSLTVCIRALLVIVLLATASTVTTGERAKKASRIPGGFSKAVVFATNSVYLKNNARVLSGDVIVNDFSDGPMLDSAAELVIGKGVLGSAYSIFKADSVLVKKDAVIEGEVHYFSDITNKGVIGILKSGLELPVFQVLPEFIAAPPGPNAKDVRVASSQSIELPEGEYGEINSLKGATITFTGGVYRIRTLNIGNNNHIYFTDPTLLIIEEKLQTSQDSNFGPGPESDINTSQIKVYVNGINGNTRKLDASPKAVEFGHNNEVSANIYAPNGTIYFKNNTKATGSFLGRDVLVGIGVEVGLDSYYDNLPPLAVYASVVTGGTTPVEISLNGIDPEGDDLSFSIVTNPTEGDLGELVEGQTPPRTRATVTYTAYTADNLPDSFTFQVDDGNGGTDTAEILINPEDTSESPEDPPTTVVVDDLYDETEKGTPMTVTLVGDAPEEVSLTFSIVEGSGPDPQKGSLSGFTQGGETPQRTASVTYTPMPDHIGEDSFDFTACGEIGGAQVCVTATATINTVEVIVETGPLAENQEVETPENNEVEVTLNGNPGGTASGQARTNDVENIIIDASIAGNVADSNSDGYGDNHNDLPGPAPVLISAAVDATGGPGSNGTIRIHIEWNVSDLAESQVGSAIVNLNTNKGSVDELDTFFFPVSTDGNGTLEDTDFESSTGVNPLATMSVTDVPSGTDGEFSFNVTAEVQEVVAAGYNYFSVQGRVDESLIGGGFLRGLQVYSTADGEYNYLEPNLTIITPTTTLSFSIVTAPQHGILKDSTGAEVTGLPYALPSATLTYTPNENWMGNDSFEFEASDGTQSATATVFITVVECDCFVYPKECCDNGRGD